MFIHVCIFLFVCTRTFFCVYVFDPTSANDDGLAYLGVDEYNRWAKRSVVLLESSGHDARTLPEGAIENCG